MRYLPGLVALEVNYFFSQLAVSMASMFGIVFVYKLGGNLYQGLLYLVGFYGLQRLMVIVILPLLPHLLPKMGYRWLMATSLIAELGKILSFVMAKELSPWFLFPAAILGSYYLSAYELGFHGLFLSDNDNKRLGEQIGWLNVVQNTGLILAPLLAGTLIDKIGFTAVFLIASVILFMSILPLFMMPKHKHAKHSYSLKKVAELLDTEKEFSGSVAFWYLTNSVTEFFWPIYIISTGRGYSFLGGLKSLVMVGSSISTLILGKVYDRRPLKRIFVGASMVEAGMWVLRFAASSTIWLIGADVTGKLMNPAWWMKIRRYELEIGERVEKMVFGVAHELMVSLGYLAGLVVCVWILTLSHGIWGLLALPAIGGIVVSAWLVRDD
jgi:MFS family permease